MGSICQRTTDALVKSSRLSLDAIKRRMQQTNKYASSRVSPDSSSAKAPLFKSKVILSIPNIVLKPSLDDIQSTLNKSVEIILSACKDVKLWKYCDLHYQQQQMEAEAARKMGED